MKKPASFTSFILIALLGFSQPASAADQSEWWDFAKWVDANRKEDSVAVTVGEQITGGGTTSRINSYQFSGGWMPEMCGEIGTYPCDSQSLITFKKRLLAITLMPQCTSPSAGDCFSDLVAYKPDGTKIVGKYLRTVPNITFKANSSMDFPATGGQLLYKLPGLIHKGGTDEYAIEYVQQRYYEAKPTPRDMELSVSIVPFLEVADPEATTLYKKTTSKSNVIDIGNGGVKPGNSWMEKGKLGKLVRLGDPVEFEISIRASKRFGGWIRGRFENPDLRIVNYSDTQQFITLRAGAIEVPRLAAVINEETWDQYVKLPKNIFFRHKGQAIGGDANDALGTFPTLEGLRVASNDRAVGSSQIWLFATVPPAPGSSCFSGVGVKGVVSTNAAVYSGSAPKMNGGFLEYKVGGLHYLANGELALGTYDLAIRSDVARCLYKIPKVPLTATLTISGESEQNIATTVVGESKGWLRLSAKGFTFSAKNLQVKISAKSQSITCARKGDSKTTKTVTGVNPKCPTGYIKVS